MKKEDIEHLASLARIALTEEQCEKYTHEFDEILGYVNDIRSITNEQVIEKKVGKHANIFREDANPHEEGLYTEALVKAAPKHNGAYIEVKKILEN